MCKTQISVSHSSTESEIISLDAGLRLDGRPALDLWDLIVAVLHGNTYQSMTYLRNIQDLLPDGTTPHERRFGMPFNGPVMPFGALVENHPISAKDMSRLQKFGPKVLPGIFLGYASYAGGIWK